MPKIIIKDLGDKGKASFSGEFIKKGTIMIETNGVKIPLRAIDSLLPVSLKMNCFQIEKDFFLCPFDEYCLNGIFLVNHSCQPNCGIYDKIKLVAMRDILPGEEITIDYAFCDAEFPGMDCEPFETFACLCGADNCRKVIRGTDWRNKELHQKYRIYFSAFIQAMIAELELKEKQAERAR